MHHACVEMNDCLISSRKIVLQKVGQAAVSVTMTPVVYKSTMQRIVLYVIYHSALLIVWPEGLLI